MFSTAANAVVLASFANMVSRSDFGIRYGHNGWPPVLLSQHIHSRQATLHAAHDSVHCLAGSYPGSYAIGPRLGVQSVVAQDQVSTENGSYAPCHWSAPGILNPQHPP